MQPTTKIIAHRGFSSKFPENTLVAFRKAIEIGADYIELDVHKTKDHKIVVIHDDSVERTSSSGENGLIAEMTLSEVEKINVGYPEKFGVEFQNEKIPTLQEVLELAKGKIKVCIDIKVVAAEEEILKIINSAEMNEEVILFSFYPEVLLNIRSLNKDIPLLFLVDEITSATLSFATKMNCKAIGVGLVHCITKELLDDIHALSLELWQWTVDKETIIVELIEVGLDGIITNIPDIAISKKTINKK